MHIHKSYVPATLLLSIVLIAGCAGPADQTAVPSTTSQENDEPSSTAETTGEAAADASADDVASTVSADSSVPPRPTAAAPVDADLREDSPLHVAATGRPQVIEFFAFW